jgi:O-antigen/teichoic acid export membrane protein
MPHGNTLSPAVSLKVNFSWALLGNLSYGACQWLMIVIIAKLGTPEMVGRFGLAFAVSAPLVMFANLNLRVVQATDAKHEYSFGNYLTLRIIMLVGVFCIITGLSMISSYSIEVRWVIIVVSLAKILESLSDVYFGLFQKHECMYNICISLLVKGLASLVLLSIGLYITKNLVWGVIGVAIGFLLVLVFYDIPFANRVVHNSYSVSRNDDSLCPVWDKGALKKLVCLTLPLGIATLLASLLSNIPRYFIESMLGERALGIFTAMAFVMTIGVRMVNALGESASPRLAKYYVLREMKKYRMLLFKLIVMSAVLGILGVLVANFAGKALLTIIYRPEYGEYNQVFIYLMIAAVVNYVALSLQHGMNTVRIFKSQPIVFGISSLALSLACWLLIPYQGLLGAAIAIIIGFVVMFFCSLAAMWNVARGRNLRKPFGAF